MNNKWYNYELGITNKGIELIKKFEGCRLKAYQDSVDVWTIGYGHTEGVYEGMEISQHQADTMLASDLGKYGNYINEYVTVALNPNQFDALTSWVYNLGPGNLKSSTMLKVLNEGSYDDVPFQIKRWNKAGGKVLKGLVRRREAEAELFATEDDWIGTPVEPFEGATGGIVTTYTVKK